jgi:hypothetical protein
MSPQVLIAAQAASVEQPAVTPMVLTVPESVGYAEGTEAGAVGGTGITVGAALVVKETSLLKTLPDTEFVA